MRKKTSGISVRLEKKHKRWCVRISATLTPNNREQKKRFPWVAYEQEAVEKNVTSSAIAFLAAKKWATEQNLKKVAMGVAGFTLSPAANTDACAATRLLDGRATLLEAAEELIRLRFPRGDKKLLSEAVETYLLELKNLGRSPIYIRGVDDPLRGLAKSCPTKHVHEIAREEIEKFLDSRKCSNNGYNHYAQDIARFWRWAGRQGWTNTNPAATIPEKSQQPTEIGILTPPEALRLLTAAKEHALLPFVILGLFTGLRSEELCRLTWDKVLLEDEEPRVLLPARSSKDHEFRGIDLPENAVSWLKTIPFRVGNVVPLSRVADSFTLLHQKCLGRPWPRNAMRHSFVSYIARLQGESKAAEAAGHESVRMTRQHYKALVTKRAAVAYFGIQPTTTPAELALLLAVPAGQLTVTQPIPMKATA